MGPTRTDTLARLIIRRYIERDLRQSQAEKAHQTFASHALEPGCDEFRDQVSGLERIFSSSQDASKPTDELTQFPTMPIFVLLCIIMIVVALVAAPIFELLCVVMIFTALVASIVLSFRY